MNFVVIILIILATNFIGSSNFGEPICPRICGVEHKHKAHKKDYDCGQEICIHMLKK
jgi:hypothetical protein|tara:strand:- start:4273 stop:4443 length:171 start_codon:yes stop_codon:yes gene_type:complete